MRLDGKVAIVTGAARGSWSTISKRRRSSPTRSSPAL
jgi:hypothetical protein